MSRRGRTPARPMDHHRARRRPTVATPIRSTASTAVHTGLPRSAGRRRVPRCPSVPPRFRSCSAGSARPVPQSRQHRAASRTGGRRCDVGRSAGHRSGTAAIGPPHVRQHPADPAVAAPSRRPVRGTASWWRTPVVARSPGVDESECGRQQRVLLERAVGVLQQHDGPVAAGQQQDVRLVAGRRTTVPDQLRSGVDADTGQRGPSPAQTVGRAGARGDPVGLHPGQFVTGQDVRGRTSRRSARRRHRRAVPRTVTAAGASSAERSRPESTTLLRPP